MLFFLSSFFPLSFFFFFSSYYLTNGRYSPSIGKHRRKTSFLSRVSHKFVQTNIYLSGVKRCAKRSNGFIAELDILSMRWKDFSPFIRPMYLKCVFEFFLEILTLFLRKNLFRDAYINFSNNKFDLYNEIFLWNASWLLELWMNRNTLKSNFISWKVLIIIENRVIFNFLEIK